MQYITTALVQLAQVISNDGIDLPNQVDPGRGSNSFAGEQVQIVLQYTFGILAAIAILVIIIAALQYVLSAGDSQKVARAKDTIIYAVVGLVVAIMAFAIVSFVLDGVFS